MNKLIIISSLTLGLFFTSCREKSTLDQLKEKQTSLKAEISEIAKEIAVLDTTNKEIILIVSSTIVEQSDFKHKIELQGNVETDQNILINSETPGVIRKIHVKEGQHVSKGQTLITIDAEILNSNINELKTSLEMANYMFNKQTTLNEQGLGTEIELEQAKNQKRSLESKLKTLQSQRGKSTIKAPFSGVIDQIFANLGEMASPQAPLIRLVNNRNIKITTSVSETHLANLKMGTSVDVIFPDLNDTTIQSVITYIGNYIDPVNRTFRVHVELKNNSVFLPNQIAKIKITDTDLKDALIINSNAILQDTDNQFYVYKLISTGNNNEYSLEKVFIKLIKSYQGKSAISTMVEDTLVKASKIVLAGGKGVTENDIVKIQ